MKARFGDRVSSGKSLVLSKSLAAQFECDRLWACISVCTYKIDWPRIDGRNRIALLQQSYPDWDKEHPEDGITKSSLMSPEQGREVVDFVKQHWENAELVVIHCEAGISRSAATAAAIHEMLGEREESQFYFTPPFHPNMHVYRTILNAWRENGPNEETTTEESE